MAYLFCSDLPVLIETQVTLLLVRNWRLALPTKSLSQTFFEALGPKATTPCARRANRWEDGSPTPGSWKPFLTAAEGGGGGGGAAEPGRSGGSGGRAPLWLSSPAREGSWGVVGKALEVLPFLLMGGGGGSGPRARQEASTQKQLNFIPGVSLPVDSHCWHPKASCQPKGLF